MIMHGDLPPVGHKISLHSSLENSLVEFLGGHQYWVDSGTSALALAVLDAKTYFPQVQNPRVIIPGYCCPDLVAACIYAGVEPMAVDICTDDPSYDLEQLRAQLDEDVVAVIAVNFLGIAERLTELRQLIRSSGFSVRLIEDNAQWFPMQKEDVTVDSDYTIFSFGRGKPLSLLGGGLLLSRKALAETTKTKIGKPVVPSLLLPFKVKAYNFLLTPKLFLLLNRNPFFHLGETRYVALEKINAMDSFRISLVSENFSRYLARTSLLAAYYDDVLVGNNLQQFGVRAALRRKQLLRYPLLCASAEQRDNLLAQLRKLGLGATAMYPAAIDQIDGVNGLVSVPKVIGNAEQFAQKFMTLPVHSGVTKVHRDKILALLKKNGIPE